MSFGQWPSDYLGVPLEGRFNFNPLTYFLYSGIDGAWFDTEDMSTMFQDAAGTTPVTALEQPVGLWLDKSRGLELGPELVVNGGFDSTTAWITANGTTISGGKLTASNAVDATRQTINGFVLGNTYKITFTIDSISSGKVQCAFSGSITPHITQAGTYTIYQQTTTTDSQLYIGSGGVSTTYVIDNISVREINGNHATQSITASRPTLSARYNLLTKTEDFNDDAWAKMLGSVSNVSITNPIDAAWVSKFVPDTTSGIHRISQMWNPINGVNYTQGVFLKSAGIRYVYINIDANAGARIAIDLQTGAYVTGGVTATNPIVINRGDGWFFVSISGIGTSVVGNNTWFQANNMLSISDATFAGNGIDGFYIIAAQLNTGATPLPYQRVNTSTDYDSVGWPKYLRGDGIDDFYNLPFLNLYGNGSCSIVAARDAVSQAINAYIISERSTTDADPKYFPSRQLASGGNMDSYIVSDKGTVRLDTTGSAFSGVKLAAIRSVVDSGSNIKLFKDGAVVADDNYTRAGTLTLNNTTLGASVSTTTSNYANMRLYGLIITKSALSDTDRRRCEQFLASRLSTLGVTLS